MRPGPRFALERRHARLARSRQRSATVIDDGVGEHLVRSIRTRTPPLARDRQLREIDEQRPRRPRSPFPSRHGDSWRWHPRRLAARWTSSREAPRDVPGLRRRG